MTQSLPPVPQPVRQHLSSLTRDVLERMLFQCHQLLNQYADPFVEIDDREALLGDIWGLLSDKLYGPGTLSSFDELLSREPRRPNPKPERVPLQDLIKASNLVARSTGDRNGPLLGAKPSASEIRQWLMWNDRDGEWDFLRRADDEDAIEALRHLWPAESVQAWLRMGQAEVALVDLQARPQQEPLVDLWDPATQTRPAPAAPRPLPSEYSMLVKLQGSGVLNHRRSIENELVDMDFRTENGTFSVELFDPGAGILRGTFRPSADFLATNTHLSPTNIGAMGTSWVHNKLEQTIENLRFYDVAVAYVEQR